MEVLYNPLLDDCEHACKSSKGGIFVFLDDSEHVAGAYAQNKNTSARPCAKNVGLGRICGTVLSRTYINLPAMQRL